MNPPPLNSQAGGSPQHPPPATPKPPSYLPGGSSWPALRLLNNLHSIGINIFAIDYRGYGQSAATHPSEKHARRRRKHLALPNHHPIIPSSPDHPLRIRVKRPLSPRCCHNPHRNPSPDPGISPGRSSPDSKQGPRAKLVPTSLLFHEDFPLLTPLSTLKTPKLLLSITTPSAAFKTAADPQATVEFNAAQGLLYNQPAYSQAITRFLDQYLAVQPSR